VSQTKTMSTPDHHDDDNHDGTITTSATMEKEESKKKKLKKNKKQNKKENKKDKKRKQKNDDDGVDGHDEISSKKKHKVDSEEKIDEKPGDNNDNDSDEGDENDDDDDDDILAAVAAWAGDDEDPNLETASKDKIVKKQGTGQDRNDHARPPSLSSLPSSSSTKKSDETATYSLHLTQLPFDATDFDIRKLFSDHGIGAMSVLSVRMVYDHDVQTGRKTVFRGVAFVDMTDEQSYDRALKLNHKVRIRGRKLNIRPTRTKLQLAEIVSKTRERVQEAIRKGLSSGGGQVSNKSDTSKGTKANKKESKNSRSSPNKEIERSKRRNDDNIDKSQQRTKKTARISSNDNKSSNNKSSIDTPSTNARGIGSGGKIMNKDTSSSKKTKNEGGGDGKTEPTAAVVKLTKKQRNKKAQIIMQGIRKGKGRSKPQQKSSQKKQK
jgi:RNA recognition motif. (a.k.a. RRM, RBD, or RNP domain)